MTELLNQWDTFSVFFLLDLYNVLKSFSLFDDAVKKLTI